LDYLPRYKVFEGYVEIEQESRYAGPKEIHPTTNLRIRDAVKVRFWMRLEVVPDAS